MHEVFALSALYLASSLCFEVYEHRKGVEASWLLRRPKLVRLFAVVLVVAAVYAWRATEPGPAAYLVALVALMSFGTWVTLGASVYPRLIRGLSWLSLGVMLLSVLRGYLL